MRNFSKLLATFGLIAIWCPVANAQLTGSYTIGASGDYTSVVAAVSALNSQGVSGPVVFDISNGLYPGQITLDSIQGVSAANTVTFRSVSGLASDVLIYYSATGAGDNWVLKFDSTDYVAFENIRFYNSSTGSYSSVVLIEDDCRGLTLDGCTIEGHSTTSSSINKALITAPGDNDIFDDLTINACDFVNGSYLISLEGKSTRRTTGVVISNCTTNGTYYGVYLNYLNDFIFQGNKITCSYSDVVKTDYCGGSYVIRNNQLLHNSGNANGIYLYYSSGTSGAEPLLANNMIVIGSAGNTASVQYGIDLYQSSYVKCYHNSVEMNGADYSGVALYVYGGTNLKVANNIFSARNGGSVIYTGSSASFTTFDYNAFYSPGHTPFEWLGTKYKSFDLFRSATSTNANSQFVYPNYFSTTDLKTKSRHLDGAGTTLVDVANDMEGDSRELNPDLGADEYQSFPGAPLNGTYSIGNGGDFITINDALDSMMAVGISGAVVFELVTGSYVEQFEVKDIPGASAIHTVTFTSQSGDSTDVTIAFSGASAADNYVARFNGADYVRFEKLSWMALGTSYGRVISLLGYTNDIRFSNSVFTGSGTASSNIDRSIFYGNTCRFDSLAIRSNKMSGGSRGLYLTGISNADKTIHLNVSDNISNDGHTFLYVQYTTDVNVIGNEIYESTTDAISLNTCYAPSIISGNKIVSSVLGNSGISFGSCSGAFGTAHLVSNNMISIGGGGTDAIGIYLNYSSYCNVYHNSVWLNSNSNSNYALYQTLGDNINIQNNIFGLSGNGYAYFVNTPSAVVFSDYNNLYSSSNLLASWGGTSYVYATLADLQAASGKDAHSVSIHPAFVSTNDLHAQAVLLDNLGTLLPDVAADIDGAIRPSTPDIGAAEFGATLQPMAGDYVVATSGGDYATMNDAVSDLIIRGMSDSVRFLLAPGTYNEQVSIPEIAGASATRRIIFASLTGNPQDVLVTTNQSISTENYTIEIRGTDFITLRNLSVSNTTTTYGRLISLRGHTRDVIIEDNFLLGVSGNQSSDSYAVVSANGNNPKCDNLIIRNNTISGGGYGVNLSLNSAEPVSGVQIIGNFINSYGYGINVSYANSVVVKENRLEGQATRGIVLYYCDGAVRVIGNTIYTTNNPYGILLSYCDAIIGSEGLVYNNMIQCGSSGSPYGLKLDYCTFQDVYYNSVLVNTTGTSSAAMHFYSCTNVRSKNNSAVHNGNGYAYSVSNTGLSQSDYNNLRATGTKYVNWNNTDYATLATYQAASSKEANSVNMDPGYLATSNLHLGSGNLQGKGTPISGITVDIDGDTRDAITPDIGADEMVCSTPVIAVSADTVCLGETTSLANESTIVADGSLYFWDFDADGIHEDTTAFDVDTILTIFATAGTHDIRVTIAQPAGCLDSADFQIEIKALPVADIDGFAPLCETEAAVTMTAATSGGTWSGSGVHPSGVFDPSVAGPGDHTITYDVISDGCANQDTFATHVSGFPELSVFASAQTVCDNTTDSVYFSAEVTNSIPATCGLTYAPCSGPLDTIVLGTGTSTNGTTGAPNIFGNYYYGAKHQILYKASELRAMGFTGGKIDAIAFQLASLYGTSTYENFTVRLACTADSVMTGWKSPDFSEVYSKPLHTINAGWHTIEFDQPYAWDGLSHLILDVCFNNATYSSSSPTYNTATSFISVLHYRANSNDVCTNYGAASTSTSRPNTKFRFCSGGNQTSFNFSWSPQAGLGNPNDAFTAALVSQTDTFVVTVSDSEGLCVNYDTITVQVVESLMVSLTHTDVNCDGGTDGSAEVTATGGVSPYTYVWSNGSTDLSVTSLSAGQYFVSVTSNGYCPAVDTIQISEPTALSVSENIQDNLCAQACEGVADLAVSGGTSPYSYAWSVAETDATITGLCSGTYDYTVTDANNCEFVGTILISEPSAWTTSMYKNNVSSCLVSDGYAEVIPSGGTATFDYLWSTGGTDAYITNLTAGTYVVTVTDQNGCMATDTAMITQPGGITLSLTSADNSCYGSCDGTVQTTIVGGQTPLTYIWSDGNNSASRQNLCAGVYGLTVTDANNCFDTATVTIAQPGQILVTASATESHCPLSDGSLSATATGGFAPLDYQWSTGDSTLNVDSVAAGQYAITVTDAAGCSEFKVVVVNDATGPQVTLGTMTPVYCVGESTGAIQVTVSGGVSPLSYNWSNGEVTEDLSGLEAGPYELVVTDANGCIAGILAEVTENSAITLVTASVQAGCGISDGSVSVTATGGSNFFSYSWSQGSNSSVVNNIAAGAYTVTVSDSNGCTESKTVAVSESGGPSVSVLSMQPADCAAGVGGSITITVGGGTSPYTYLWSNGATTQNLAGASAGDYAVTVTGTGGCIATASGSIVPLTSDGTPICLVTVDSTSGTNKVIWEKLAGVTADHYNVYRESSQSGVYQKIGMVDADSLSEYTDPIANPMIRSWRYKIASVDTCGNESPLSQSHKTIHLNINLGLNSTINLIWDHYQGFNFSTYYIYRYTNVNGWELIDSLPNTLTSYTDFNPPSLTTDLYYIIEAQPITPCNATKAKTYNSSRSNVSQSVGAPVLTASTSSVNSNFGQCDGEASATPAGGMSPYTYAWDGNTGSQTSATATGLCDGTYSVTVTDFAGNITIVFATVDENTQLIANVSTTNAGAGLCDGSATVSVSGGQPAYTYLWDANANSQTTAVATGLCAGTYEVSVTDANGADTIVTATVGENTQLAATTTITNANFGLCDGTAMVNPTGGISPYTYLWDGNTGGQTTQTATGLCDGTYSVTVSDSDGNSTIVFASVGEHPQLIATTSSTLTTPGNCEGTATVTASGGVPPYSYLWDATASNQTTATATGLCGGAYTVTVTDQNGITTTSQVVVDMAFGIKDPNHTAMLKLYPNPVTDYLNLEILGIVDQSAVLELSSIEGRAVLRLPVTTYSMGKIIRIDIGSLASGVYQLTLRDNNHIQQSLIVIQ